MSGQVGREERLEEAAAQEKGNQVAEDFDTVEWQV